jgi:arginase
MRKATIQAIRERRKILSLGGNHLRATELLGMLKACHELGIEMGIVWMDAHPDQNTPETSLTKNVHGMVGAIAMGEGPAELLELIDSAPFLNPRNIVYIGINAPERQETNRMVAMLDGKGVKCVTRPELSESLEAAKDAIADVNTLLGPNAIWWNELDVDVLADKDSEGKIMPNPNGMNARELHDLCAWMGQHLNMLGCGVSEISPAKDLEGKMAKIVADSVAALLKVPNVSFAEHMHHQTTAKETEEMDGATEAKNEPTSADDEQISAEIPAQVQRPSRRREIMHMIAGLAAGIAGVIAGYQLQPPETTRAKHPIVLRQPLGKGNDTTYAFTGISSQNRFIAPNRLGVDNYSMETLQDTITEYKHPQKYASFSEDKRKRMLFSILYLGEMNGHATAMVDEVRKEFGPDTETVLQGYSEFSSYMSQLEHDEIKRYLELI